MQGKAFSVWNSLIFFAPALQILPHVCYNPVRNSSPVFGLRFLIRKIRHSPDGGMGLSSLFLQNTALFCSTVYYF